MRSSSIIYYLIDFGCEAREMTNLKVQKFIILISYRIQRAFFSNIKLFTSTSVFLALNAQLVVVFSSLLYGVMIKPELLLIAFFLTLSVYNMNKVTDFNEDTFNQPESVIRGKNFYLLPSITSLILCILLSLFAGIQTLLVVLTSLFASIAYSVKLFKSIPRLKEVVGVKSILVAFSWGLTGAVLPASVQKVEPKLIILSFTFIFFQLFINTILCDVRDFEGDKLAGLRTIPIELGLNKTRSLLLIVNSLILPWLAYCYSHNLFLDYLPNLLFSLIYGYVIIIFFSTGRSSRLRVDLVVDGEWIPLVAIMRFF